MDYPPTDQMSAEEALATAEREGLTLQRGDNKAGYKGVAYVSGKARAYQAIVRRRGETVRLGRFFTPEEAALCRARTPEGKAALDKAEANEAKGAFLSAEEAEQQAAAEGLVLQRADSQTGFVGVSINNSSNVKPFEARVRRNGRSVSLGHFATPEAAALNVARSAAEDPPSKRKPSRDVGLVPAKKPRRDLPEMLPASATEVQASIVPDVVATMNVVASPAEPIPVPVAAIGEVPVPAPAPMPIPVPAQLIL